MAFSTSRVGRTFVRTVLTVATLLALSGSALRAGGELLVEVQQPDGSPVPSAEVVVATPLGNSSVMVFAWSEVRNGRASLLRPVAGAYVSIYAPTGTDGQRLNLVPSEAVPVPTDGETLMIRMKPGREIRGSVVGTDGKPLAQVHIAAHPVRLPQVGTPRLPSNREHAQARSDAAGRFVLRGLTQDRQELRLRRLGTRIPSDPRTVAPDAKDVILRALTSKTVRISVLDDQGEPVRGAHVVVTYRHGPGTWTPPQGDTDSSGVVVIRDLPANATSVSLSVSPPHDRRDLADATRSNWELADDVIALDRGWTLRGRVVGADGAGVRAKVHVALPNGRSSRTTDETGRFECSGLPLRPVRLAAVPPGPEDGLGVGPPGLAEDWFKYEAFEPTEKAVDVRLQSPTPATQTMLQILGPAGRPISSAYVDIWRTLGAGAATFAGMGTAIRRAQMTLPLSQGPLSITLKDVKDAEGNSVGPRLQRTLLFADGTKHTVRVEHPKTLRGRILAPDGSPASGAAVRAACVGSDAPSQESARALTDEQGRFQIAGLASDIYKLLVTPLPPHVAPAPVFVGPDLESAIQIHLPAPLLLRVLDPDGAPVDGARVITARPLDPYDDVQFDVDATPGPLTEADGYVHVAPPDEGTWLRVLPPGGRRDLGPAGPFKPGSTEATIQLPPRRRIEVRCRLGERPWRDAVLEWRAPGAFASLVLQRYWDADSEPLASDGSGRLVWEPAPAGAFQVRAMNIPFEESAPAPLGTWSPWVDVDANDEEIMIAAPETIVGRIHVAGADRALTGRMALCGPGVQLNADVEFGPEGTAAVGVSPAIEYTVIVRGIGADGRGCAYGNGITFTGTPVTLPVVETHVAHLRVAVPDGAPASHRVFVLSPWGELACTREEDGNWATPPLPPGEWEVLAVGRWRTLQPSLFARVTISLPAKQMLPMVLRPTR